MTKRAVIVGAILSLVLAAGEPYGVGLVRGSPLCADFSTGFAVFLFFLVTFGNLLLRKINPRLAFATGELAVIYIMMIVACALPSWGFTMNLVAMMAGVKYFGLAHSDWQEVVYPNLKWHLLISDQDACNWFYQGLPAGASIPWALWIKPLAWWFSFMIVLCFVSICVVVILRKRWADEERLTFPLTELPLEMIRTEPTMIATKPFYANPVAWLGFLVPFAWHSINALHSYYPAIPILKTAYYVPLPVKWQTYLTIRLFFEVVGLSYLLSSDVSLSLWFFALLGTLEVGALNNFFVVPPPELVSDPGTPPVAFQGLGAMTVLVAMSFWRARPHLREVMRKALHKAPDVDDSREALPYRTAVFGILWGGVFLLWWLARSGMGWLAAAVVLAIAFVVFVGLTRVVSQAGLAYGRPPVAIPVATLHALGTQGLGQQAVGALGLSMTWSGDTRTLAMTSAANGLKISDVTGTGGKRIGVAMMIAVVASLTAAATSTIIFSYHHGAGNMGGWSLRGFTSATVSMVSGWMSNQVPVGWDRLGYMSIGGILFLGLTFIREQFVGFPLHPIGLCLGLAGPFAWVWFSVFIAWLIKVLVLRYTGLRGFVISRPFFLGMVLGSFTAAGVWIIIDGITGVPGNVFTLG